VLSHSLLCIHEWTARRWLVLAVKISSKHRDNLIILVLTF